MSGESPEDVSRDQLLLLAMMFSKVISVPPFNSSVPPFNSSVESFAWGKALVHPIAFFPLL